MDSLNARSCIDKGFLVREDLRNLLIEVLVLAGYSVDNNTDNKILLGLLDYLLKSNDLFTVEDAENFIKYGRSLCNFELIANGISEHVKQNPIIECNKITYTYLIDFKDKIKIGKSSNPMNRIKSLKKHHEHYDKHYYIAGDYEKILLDKYHKYRIHGEYFKGIEFNDICNYLDSLSR